MEKGAEKLVDIFNRVWKNYHEIDSSSEPTSSAKFQQLIQDNLSKLSLLVTSLEQLSMFSDNEDIEEVSTSDLRYFLVPPLIASFNLKQQCDIKSRPELLQLSLEHLKKFLTLCLNYKLGSYDEIQNTLSDKSYDPVGGKPNLQMLNAARNAKIAKYRKAKLQAQQIQELESKLHDEEISRKYWILQIDKWIGLTIDEIASLKMEMNMLERMKNISPTEIEESKKAAAAVSTKPFVLTKDKLQASVFGAGYPSLPTMTLEEYFNREVEAGRLPDQPSKPAVEKQNDSDDDDNDEKVKKQREFDDWKDTHRRGAGNRKNMG